MNNYPCIFLSASQVWWQWCWTTAYICLYITRTMLNCYLYPSFYEYDYTGVKPLSASFSLPVWWHQDDVEPLPHKCDDIDVEPLPVYFYLTSVMTLMLNHYLYLSLYFTRCWTAACLFLSDYIDDEPLPAPVSLLHMYDDINVEPLPASVSLHHKDSVKPLPAYFYKYDDPDVEPLPAYFSLQV